MLSSSASISWTGPSTPNGNVERYVLTSVDQLTEDSVTWYDGPARGTTVSGLTPYSRYVFTVSACTRVGCLNDSVAVVTLQAAPQGQSPPNIAAHGPTSLNVTWRPPSRPNGNVVIIEKVVAMHDSRKPVKTVKNRGCSGVVVEYWTRNREVARSTHTRSTANNLEQVANLLCAQANSTSQGLKGLFRVQLDECG